jgi:hypothetical protein
MAVRLGGGGIAGATGGWRVELEGQRGRMGKRSRRDGRARGGGGVSARWWMTTSAKACGAGGRRRKGSCASPIARRDPRLSTNSPNHHITAKTICCAKAKHKATPTATSLPRQSVAPSRTQKIEFNIAEPTELQPSEKQTAFRQGDICSV